MRKCRKNEAGLFRFFFKNKEKELWHGTQHLYQIKGDQTIC